MSSSFFDPIDFNPAITETFFHLEVTLNHLLKQLSLVLLMFFRTPNIVSLTSVRQHVFISVPVSFPCPISSPPLFAFRPTALRVVISHVATWGGLRGNTILRGGVDPEERGCNF